MTEPVAPPAPPLRTWRPMAAWMLLAGILAAGCLPNRSSSLPAAPDLPGARKVEIIAFEQLTFPKTDKPGDQIVLADFRVTFRDLDTRSVHTCLIKDAISSFPSGPVNVLERGKTMEYSRLRLWTPGVK